VWSTERLGSTTGRFLPTSRFAAQQLCLMLAVSGKMWRHGAASNGRTGLAAGLGAGGVPAGSGSGREWQYAQTAWKISEGFSKGGITSIAQTPEG
jgi:hypothetical protein